MIVIYSFKKLGEKNNEMKRVNVERTMHVFEMSFSYFKFQIITQRRRLQV